MTLRFVPRIAVTFTAALSALAFSAPPAGAFTHIVKPRETLAAIAARVYGDARFETILVGANTLDAQGGSAIVPGMRIEIPAPGHHRVEPGETWPELALTWLGDPKRADALARANGGLSWVPPTEGQEIAIPPVIAHIAGDNETSSTVAAHYLGNINRGWELNAFNDRKEAPLRRGEILLVPLLDVELTEAGKAEARAAGERSVHEGETAGLDAQKKVDAELPSLFAEVRSGRYVEAVARGNRLLGTGQLTRPELAGIHRALLEAYVALDASGPAAGACAAWKANEAHPRLDPRSVSPKIRAACAPQ